MKNHIFILLLIASFVLECCEQTTEESNTSKHSDIELITSDSSLAATFDWAKAKARSYVQTGKKGGINISEVNDSSVTVDYMPSYWAGYPGRSAFYSRDFVHQAIGAHLLGLQEENFRMLRAFAQSADEGKKWYPLWAINFDGSPFILDYRSDESFVREVPATFELVEKALDLYQWTGDSRYFEDSVLWNYYSKAVSDFVYLHDTQIPNGVAEGTGKGIFSGAASYNEQRDYPLVESGDGIASQYRAFEAFAHLARLRGEQTLSEEYHDKAVALKTYFIEKWSKSETGQYNRGYLADGNPIAGWGKENSWFMPMKGIGTYGSMRTSGYLDFIDDRLTSKDDIPDNIEALTYIPETFFLHHRNETAWKWSKHIMANLKQDHTYQAATGRNGDYPEVSYVLIQNMVVDLLGIEVDMGRDQISTLSHLPKELSDLGVKNLPLGRRKLQVLHTGPESTEMTYISGEDKIIWTARFAGKHEKLSVDGNSMDAASEVSNGLEISYVNIELNPGEKVTVSSL